MIETIERACRLVAAPAASPIEVARGLGTIVEGGEGDHEIVVRPPDRSVRAATVVARIDAPETDLVVLDPSPEARLTVADLVAAFGAYREGPRTRPGSPRRFVFHTNFHGPTNTCAVIAEVAAAQGEIGGEPVERVTVRRDPILR
ncbi:MAG: hypothetical protein ACRDIY_17970 [Chloroflexota bacterium]